MTALLALVTVLVWGSWIPLAQAVPGASQRARVFYVTLGNLVVASLALIVGGGAVGFGWKTFWLPVAGGAVWVAGNYTAFRASEAIGLARANGTWAPLNIIVSFVWGALLFGELGHTSAWRLTVLGVSLVLVVAGVLIIVRSQDVCPEGPAPNGAVTATSPTTYVGGLLFAVAAGCLWGSYFIPSQWAGVAAQVGNFPLALGIVVAGALLASSGREKVRLEAKPAAVLLVAGCLFGVGNITLLGLVARVGTGVGFTIAQLALLVSASIGIFVFKVPRPGSLAARRAIIGILMAGAGGVAIGSLK